MGRRRTGHAGRILSGAVAVLVAASGVLVAPVVHLVPAQPVRAAAAFADPFFREDVDLLRAVQPDLGPLRLERARVRHREERPDPDLRLHHRHDPHDRGRPHRRGDGLLGPGPAGPRRRPGLPDAALPVRVLRAREPARPVAGPVGRRLPGGPDRARRNHRRMPASTKVDRITIDCHQRHDGAIDPHLGLLPAVPEPLRGRDGVRARRAAVRGRRRRGVVQRHGLRPAGRDGSRPCRSARSREPLWRPGDRHVPVRGNPHRRRLDGAGRHASLAGHPHDQRRRGPGRLAHPGRPGTRAPRRRQPDHVRERQREADRRARVPEPVPDHLPAGHARPVRRERRQPDLGGDRPARASRPRDADDAAQRGLAMLRGTRPARVLRGPGHHMCAVPVRAGSAAWTKPLYSYSHFTTKHRPAPATTRSTARTAGR